MAKRRAYNSKYVDRVMKALDHLDKVETEINKTYPKKYRDELDEVGKEVIARWYAAYEPRYYGMQRKGSLYDAYKVELDGTILTVEADPSLMENYTHNQSNEIIYNNAFMRGYHGGSLGDEGPTQYVPYYRTPFPEFTHWGRPAVKTESPFRMLKIEMQKTADAITKEKNDKFDKALERVVRNMKYL